VYWKGSASQKTKKGSRHMSQLIRIAIAIALMIGAAVLIGLLARDLPFAARIALVLFVFFWSFFNTRVLVTEIYKTEGEYARVGDSQ
jgi:predicted PurR-regulated permease PerM